MEFFVSIIEVAYSNLSMCLSIIWYCENHQKHNLVLTTRSNYVTNILEPKIFDLIRFVRSLITFGVPKPLGQEQRC